MTGVHDGGDWPSANPVGRLRAGAEASPRYSGVIAGADDSPDAAGFWPMPPRPVLVLAD